jgi:hypothetical protein
MLTRDSATQVRGELTESEGLVYLKGFGSLSSPQKDFPTHVIRRGGEGWLCCGYQVAVWLRLAGRWPVSIPEDIGW